jgi:hypothetical protein
MPRHVWHKHGQDRLGVPVRAGLSQYYSNACPDISQFRQPPDAVVVLGRVPGTSRPAQICLNFALSWQRWPPITERMPSTIKYFNHGRQLHVQFLRIEDAYYQWPCVDRIRRMKYWEMIADNLSKAGWSWGCVATVDRRMNQYDYSTRALVL